MYVFGSLPPVADPVSSMHANSVAMTSITDINANVPVKHVFTAYVLHASLVESSMVLNAATTSNISHAQLVAYFSTLIKLFFQSVMNLT